MLAKLAAVTVGDIWWHIWRGTVWVVFVAVIAMLLDLEPSWKLIVLMVGSSFIDGLLYGPRKAS